MEAGLFLIFAIVAAAIFIISQAAKHKRAQAWMALGAELGLSYSPGDGWIDELPFALLQRGDGRGIDHALAGARDRVEVRLFEYWYYTEHQTSGGVGAGGTHLAGSTSKDYAHFTCALAVVDLAAPHITIDREGFLSRLADHVGFRDIEFESEEFNRAVNVRCEDRRFASYLIDARMMEYLLPLDGWAFEVAGNLVLASCARLAPAEAGQVLGAALAFRDAIPRAAIDAYGGTT